MIDSSSHNLMQELLRSKNKSAENYSALHMQPAKKDSTAAVKIF